MDITSDNKARCFFRSMIANIRKNGIKMTVENLVSCATPKAMPASHKLFLDRRMIGLTSESGTDSMATDAGRTRNACCLRKEDSEWLQETNLGFLRL